MSEPKAEPAHPEPTTDQPSPQRRNFAVMVAHMVLQRTGWIFKLESVVMPAFVATLTSSTFALAALPMLNRVGRRVPTLFGGWIAHGRARLRRLLVLWMGVFAGLWGGLALVLWLAPPQQNGAFLFPFLGVYCVSFAFLGFTQVTRGALVGRVIATRRRGLYVGLSSLLGGLTAVPSGLFIRRLFTNGGALGPRDFVPLFACAFLFFLLAAATVLFVREPASSAKAATKVAGTFWQRLVHVLRQDRNFRRLVIAVLLWQVQGYVFPFYVMMGLAQGIISVPALGLLILVQNVSLAISTMVMGVHADRGGNRRVLLIAFGITAVLPLIAVCAVRLPDITAALGWGMAPWLPRVVYLGMFALIGFGPSLQRFQANYVLEISTPADHAVYLSVFEALQLSTVVYMPVVAVVVRYFSAVHAMIGASAVMAIGLVVAFRLVEPRVHPPIAPEEVPPLPVGDAGA